MTKVETAFKLFSDRILAGESGIFFSDLNPLGDREFYFGVGDYELVDFEANVFPRFSLSDWKGERNYSYSFKEWVSHESDIGSLEKLQSGKDVKLGLGFEMRGDKAADWQKKVTQVIDYQKAGEAWVLNLAHDYVSGGFQDIVEMKQKLLQIFTRFLALPQSHCAGIVITNEQIFCSLSPELFIRQKEGQLISSPIKGTGTEDYLRTSEKEKSELDMITDLLRNDLGQVCDHIAVPKRRFLVAEKNFLSARSLIEGDYPRDLTWADYRCLLPAGSISGAPKARVIDIIESLEDFTRGFYTGTMGVQVSPQDSVWNILIRTIFVDPASQRWSFPVGVGITAESDPVAEWNETWQKAQLLTDLAS